jgi:Gnt-I system high-affinity gluconate transporter
MNMIILISCILILVLLIAKWKWNAFLAFLLTSILCGLLLGMSATALVTSINKGVGDTFGSILVIIVLGAMLGRLIGDSGAANRIAGTIRTLFGEKYITWAMAFTGFLVGIPLYYNVGFVLLVPIIFSVAHHFKLSKVYIGLPMLTALSVMHGFLPPHPAAMVLAIQFQADLVKTFVYGVIIAIPAIVIAGPLFATAFKKRQYVGTSVILVPVPPKGQMPGAFNSICSSLSPVLIIALASLLSLVSNKNAALRETADLLSQPAIAMFLSLVICTVTLGLTAGKSIRSLMTSYAESVKDISMILLVIGSAGMLKQIVVDSSLSSEISNWMLKCAVPPLVLAWLITAGLRLSLGSATIAGLTAAGVIFPLVAQTGIPPELFVLTVGAGSLFGSHINDTAFWMFKEYFNLTLRETFLSWTVMESMVSVIGLIGVVILQNLINGADVSL